MRTPLTLIILDGYGLGENNKLSNAITAANTPNLDNYFNTCPHTTLSASGLDVGLPKGQMGNSEVGHTNIGAGRVVFQDLPRVTAAIEDGSLFQNPQLLGAIEHCKKNNSALHLMGLLSDGGVHSHNTHIYALLELAKKQGLDRVYIHCFMDGRDVAPTSGKDFVGELVDQCKQIGVGQIATVIGRFYAMDRDNRFERVEKAYDAIAYGKGEQNTDPVDAVAKSYANGVTDEFINPVVCAQNAQLTSDDAVIFFNFRPDRAREITRTFVDPDFDGFERKLIKPYYVCLTEYDKTMPNVTVAFQPQSLNDGFGEYISRLGLKQLRIAETEKYAHVTFFFNGGVEQEYPGEDRALIPSPKVETYDLQPEMSAYQVAERAVELIDSRKYDVIILNFANCDMVGHTGVFKAAVKAVETVDQCVGKVVEATSAMGGISMITADHGNADKMLDEDGSVFTAHTTNLVPFILCGADVKLEPGKISDIAPTMLKLMGLEQPELMTGKSLIRS